MASKLTILIPVYNDWPSLSQLLGEIHAHMADEGWAYEILVVDDASTIEMPSPPPKGSRPSSCVGETILRLRKNLGHQRAIAVGLVVLDRECDSDLVIIMDGDGQDSPRDISRLAEACFATELSEIVFARRTKRLESAAFKAGYQLYCLLHRIAVGQVPRVGNFSAVPRQFLTALAIDPNLWNHFAATVFASRLPHKTLATPRGQRYLGQSKLNFNSLVIHGLSALACYSETIGVRLVLASAAFLTMNFIGLLIVAGIRFLTPLAIPGWATLATGVLILVGIQLLTLGLAFSLVILSRRQEVTLLPKEEVLRYILERRSL